MKFLCLAYLDRDWLMLGVVELASLPAAFLLTFPRLEAEPAPQA